MSAFKIGRDAFLSDLTEELVQVLQEVVRLVGDADASAQQGQFCLRLERGFWREAERGVAGNDRPNNVHRVDPAELAGIHKVALPRRGHYESETQEGNYDRCDSHRGWATASASRVRRGNLRRPSTRGTQEMHSVRPWYDAGRNEPPPWRP